MNDTLRDDRFDASMRAHYRAATDSVPMRVRVALRAPRSDARAPWGMRWQWPAGLAAALAIGVLAFNLQRAPQPAAPALLAQATTAPANADPLALDPDFYAWLASSDAQQLAME